MSAVTLQPPLLILGALSLLIVGGLWAAKASGRLRGWEVFLVLLTALVVLWWLPDAAAVRIVTLLHP
jgi:hypothetical protein